MTLAAQVWSALGKVIDPEIRLPLTELDMLDQPAIDASGNVSQRVKLTVVGCPASDKIERDVRAAIESVEGVGEIQIQLDVMTPAERETLVAKLRGNKPARVNPFDADSLTHVLLIGSGKGGVGKSSVTANLAVELAARGHKVGLIDADIFGFSIPGQLGLDNSRPDGRPTRVGELMLPPVAHGVKVISIGMFLDANQPVAWRGPMLHRAIQQFLTDVFWGDLDYLLVDLPPGTGDVAISLGQLLPTAKSIVVTTPQAAAADVAERSGAVGLQTGQAILGVIENMSWLDQPDGTRLHIFGEGGADTVAKRLAELSGSPVEVLGQIPISVALREGSDAGSPVVLSKPADAASAAIASIAEKLLRIPRGLAGKKLNVAVQS
ncbi:MAG: Mrp/NBP35 family ATP-binding protein [Actinomycetales bacterium]|nr:Mrp/NBP35 family ATP-binding protein [Actinomycetales bacterium]